LEVARTNNKLVPVKWEWFGFHNVIIPQLGRVYEAG